jgi:hypothetical protein
MRVAEPVDVRLECRVEGLGTLAQTMPIVVTNPLRVAMAPLAKNLIVRVENPTGEAFKGMVRLVDTDGVKPASLAAAVEFQAGEQEQTVQFAMQESPAKKFRLGVRIEDLQGRLQLAIPSATLSVVDDFSRYTPETLAAAWGMFPDGDAKVASTQIVTTAPAPAGALLAGVPTLKINYTLGNGWKFVRLAPKDQKLRKIEDQPKAFGLWVYSNESKHALRLRIADSTGQVFQPGGPQMTWKGWRYVEFRLDGSDAGHWGGANDGTIHYPIHWDTLFLIDGTKQASQPPEVYVTSPVLIY